MSKRWPDKVIIGLTGNIATGKSAVMRMAAEQGALTLDADKIVHQIMSTDEAVQTAIVNRFGAAVQDKDGRIDRAALAAIVFQDPSALTRLEQILHPVVRTVIIEQVNENPANLVMIEAIKLLEGKLAAECDHIWVTRCPELKQIERLMVCRGLDGETAVMRVSAQSSQEEKVAQADVVIDTGSTMAQTRQLFDFAWGRIVQDLAGGVQAAVASAPPLPKSAPVEPVEPEPDLAAEPVETAEPLEPDQPEPEQPEADEQQKPKAPPERLSGSKAAEIRKRMLARRQETEPEPEPQLESQPTAPEPAETAEPGIIGADEIVVRRARPSDIPSILLLIQRATAGTVKIKRSELLLSLGDRGYLIGQQGSEISVVIGWNSENLIARIDQIYVYPPESADITGPAILREIEDTAVSLMCEVILAFPPSGIAPPVLKLFLDKQFGEVELSQLPDAWKTAVADSQPDNTFILIKRLRDTRVVTPL